MSAVNDIIRIKFVQVLFEQIIINVLYYKVLAIDGSISWRDFWEGLIEDIIAGMINVQHEDLAHTEQVVDNLTDGIEFFLFGKTDVGIKTGTECQPTFSAVNMTKSVNSRLTRPGSIRFCGVDGLWVDDNNLVAGAKTAYEIAGDVLAATYSYVQVDPSGDADCDPVVVGIDEFGDYDLTRINLIAEFINPRLSTQVSRKRP